ncbi:MAG: hypothetical protein ACOC3Z_02800 [Nanoarchaeota archaeon]
MKNIYFLSLIFTYLNFFWVFFLDANLIIVFVGIIFNIILLYLLENKTKVIEKYSLKILFIAFLELLGVFLISLFIESRYIVGNILLVENFYFLLIILILHIFSLIIISILLSNLKEVKFSKSLFTLFLVEVINICLIIIVLGVLMGIGFNRYGGL